MYVISDNTSHRVCKPAYLVPAASQNKLGGLCQVGMAEMGVPISLDRVAVHPDCWCICLCYLHLHQKIQKMVKCTFWYQLTRVVPDKVQRAVKMVVCVLCLRAVDG